MSENSAPSGESGIIAYDLEPPARLLPPVELAAALGWPLVPNPSGRGVAPRYVPGPQPEGTVRVVLDSAGCDGEPADFALYQAYRVLVKPYQVFDVPAEQHERWQAARMAFEAMQEEIEALVSERARNPLPVRSPGPPS